MLCPYCQSKKNQIIDTRKYDTCDLRVHRCFNCSRSWDTEEIIRVLKAPPLEYPAKTNSLNSRI